MNKIWTIARKDIRRLFTDRKLLLFYVLPPLFMVSIIGFGFSDIGGDSSEQEPIPVAVVNLDKGDPETGVNLGEMFFVSAFAPSDQNWIADWVDVTFLTTREGAIKGVDNGDYDAAIIIPADFTRIASYNYEHGFSGEQVAVEVYDNNASPYSWSVIPGFVQSLTTNVVNGQVAIGATMDTIINLAMTDPEFGQVFNAAITEGAFIPDFSRAFDPSLNAVSVVTRPIKEAAAEEQGGFNYLLMMGPAQALMFSLLMATSVAGNILEEQRNGTLQRMLMSSTSRFQIFFAKLMSTYVTILLQLVFLIIGFLLVNALIQGEFTMIWGDNVLVIGALLMGLALAVSGVGMIAAALAKNVESVNAIAGGPVMIMSFTGGAFGLKLGSSQLEEILTNISIVHWGSDGLAKLADGNTDIVQNILVLAAVGAVLFSLSLLRFMYREF